MKKRTITQIVLTLVMGMMLTGCRSVAIHAGTNDDAISEATVTDSCETTLDDSTTDSCEATTEDFILPEQISESQISQVEDVTDETTSQLQETTEPQMTTEVQTTTEPLMTTEVQTTTEPQTATEIQTTEQQTTQPQTTTERPTTTEKATTQQQTTEKATTEKAITDEKLDPSDEEAVYDRSVVLTQKNGKKIAAMLKRINKLREEAGQQPLVLDETLCYAAGMRAVEMDYGDYLGHNRYDGSRGFTTIQYVGYRYKACAENIARKCDTAKDTFNAWKNSPTHYDIMVSDKYSRIGIGYCNDNGTKVWVIQLMN